MEWLDSVFRVIFARYRRKLEDADVQLAWSRASNKIGGYLVLPVISASLLLTVALFPWVHPKTTAAHKQWGALLAVAIWLVASSLLTRRFRKYLSAVPVLAAHESPAETRMLFRFRIGTIGLSLLGFSIVFVLRSLVQFPPD